MAIGIVIDDANGGILVGARHVRKVGVVALGEDEFFLGKGLDGDFLMGATAGFIAGVGRGDGSGGDVLEEGAGRLNSFEGEWLPIKEAELVIRFDLPGHLLLGFDSGEGAVGVLDEALELGFGDKIEVVESP